MDIASLIGVVGGIACIVFGAYTSGSLNGLLDLPSVFITIGGSYMCLYITYPLSYVIGIFKVMGRVFKTWDFEEKAIVQRMVTFSEKARREGILALEEEIQDYLDEIRFSIPFAEVDTIYGVSDKIENYVYDRRIDRQNIVDWVVYE